MKKPKIRSGRAVGNTTRLVDYYIQEFFEGDQKSIVVSDHYDARTAQRMIASKVAYRLQVEHNLEVEDIVPVKSGMKIVIT